jgi:hypothetical protein
MDKDIGHSTFGFERKMLSEVGKEGRRDGDGEERRGEERRDM